VEVEWIHQSTALLCCARDPSQMTQAFHFLRDFQFCDVDVRYFNLH
jgi:hypothetical protein